MSNKRNKKKNRNRNPKVAGQHLGGAREVTINGIALTVDPQIFDDFEFLDDLNELSTDNPLRIVPAFKRVTGSRYKEVLEALRDPETGVVKATDAANTLMELMKSLNPNS